ncbi:MAG: hypothetical protein IKC37_04915 [Clostridia bacterium]|nr:hypothetical protein [Clostridia bacterium]
MKITYLGTAAAEGAPAIFCDCAACMEARKRGGKELHTRSQFLIDDDLGIDFPPDAYAHSLHFNVDLRRLQHLFITHSHMDHFYAQDFILRGYKYATPLDAPLCIYGCKEVVEVFREGTRRELKSEVARNLQMVEINAFTPVPAGDYIVTPLKANHGKTPAFVYLVEKGDEGYLHLTDTGRLPQETLEFLADYYQGKKKKVGLVTFDCTFLFHEGGETARHMGLPDNRLLQSWLEENGVCDKATKYAVTHYSHNSAPLSENLQKAEREYGYIATYDGFFIDF